MVHRRKYQNEENKISKNDENLKNIQFLQENVKDENNFDFSERKNIGNCFQLVNGLEFKNNTDPISGGYHSQTNNVNMEILVPNKSVVKFAQKSTECLQKESKQGATDSVNNYDAIIIDSSYQLEANSTKHFTNNKILMCSDISLINSFFEQSDKVIGLLRDEEFKIFSRKYILNAILKLLKTNGKETDYKKYFGHLCCLESYPEEQKDSDSKLNFIISLMNAWFLNQSRSSQLQDPLSKTLGMEENRNYQDNQERTMLREKIVTMLLINVSCDIQYFQYLESLHELEDEEDEEELVYGW